MKNRVHAWILSCVVVGVSIPAGGCNDPKSQSRRSSREQSISHVMSWYTGHEAGGPERLQRIKQINENAEAWHKKQLAEMTERMDGSFRRDYKRWKDSRGQRGEWSKGLIEGNPSEIPDTWAKMVHP